tara:strand:+ start:214 stop:867 length:654 start_codon:yes stop_codon:yes gene_type:complete
MKTKTMIVALISCLSINAAPAGGNSVDVGYASDYFRRGALTAEESVQAGASYGFKALGLDSSIGVFTNQATASSGTDTYIIDIGASKQLGELLSLYVGLEHVELVAGDASLEVNLEVGLDAVLNPTISIYRNTDEALYTYEAAVSHSFDLEVADLGLSASYGNTDVTSSNDVDYYSVGGSLTRSLSENSSLTASLDYVDSDSIENESIFGLGINVKF